MNEEKIWNFLYGKLKNPYGAAGLMGNLFAESSLNPVLANGVKKYGLTNEQYTAITDVGVNDYFVTDKIAYGLAQWCYKTRKKALLEKARSQKKSVGNLDLQLDYLWEELQKYSTVLNVLYSAKSVREASDIVLLKYEKPANTSEAVRQKRTAYGQKYYDKYTDIILNLNKLTATELTEALNKEI